ncbi:MAG: hypothetical protein JM58_12410 [Peptococcaceae bacterium BICA1-8]|nr:MAG: hypothetical protein JM58_12410 [Peptococcaceae bacterium BICA1-8]
MTAMLDHQAVENRTYKQNTHLLRQVKNVRLTYTAGDNSEISRQRSEVRKDFKIKFRPPTSEL